MFGYKDQILILDTHNETEQEQVKSLKKIQNER